MASSNFVLLRLLVMNSKAISKLVPAIIWW